MVQAFCLSPFFCFGRGNNWRPARRRSYVTTKTGRAMNARPAVVGSRRETNYPAAAAAELVRPGAEDGLRLAGDAGAIRPVSICRHRFYRETSTPRKRSRFRPRRSRRHDWRPTPPSTVKAACGAFRDRRASRASGAALIAVRARAAGWRTAGVLRVDEECRGAERDEHEHGFHCGFHWYVSFFCLVVVCLNQIATENFGEESAWTVARVSLSAPMEKGLQSRPQNPISRADSSLNNPLPVVSRTFMAGTTN